MANPADSENVSSTVKKPMAREIERLAEASGLTRSAYVRQLLEDAVRRGRIFNVRIEERMDGASAAQAEGAALLAAERLATQLKGGGKSVSTSGKSGLPSKAAAREKAHK